MIDLKRYQSVFFDCDGVILDSNQAKTNAFREVLMNYPKENVDKFIKYHQRNMGISRYGKFREFFSNINPDKDDEALIKKSIKDFSLITRMKLQECKIIPGVIDTLDHLMKKNVECYVVTGGDQEEVRYVFKQRKLDIYFRGIYGSPEDKFSNLKKIISSNEIKDPVFFGDSKVDLEVAKKYNLDFIYIYGASEWTNGRRYCHKNGYRQIKNFKSVSF
tara:strand:+ start:96 stop:749 length:654 start_codon:yes stop_codon:yes gene_type:complete